jgi:hypothetical protein
VIERNLVAIGVSTIDIVKTHGNLRYYFQCALARLEHFSINRIAQGRNQTVNPRPRLFDDQFLRGRFRLGIDLDVVSSLSQ